MYSITLQGERKQYRFRYYVTSTVHAAMGKKLGKVVVENQSKDVHYKMFEKNQLVFFLG